MASRENRRTRGEIACAECRRLKARCDRQVPCSTCIKRGCGMLCPNGTMPPGEGSRFVGVAEEYLRRKLTKMEERMHSLEDALVIVQSHMSSQPHPLLVNPPSRDDTQTKVEEESKTINEFSKYGLINALSSLRLDNDEQDGAVTSTVGPSADSESLLIKAKEIMTEASILSLPRDFDDSYLPDEIIMFYKSFPFPPSGIPTAPVQSMIESFLPPIEKATALCEAFMANMGRMVQIISREKIIGELLPAVYSPSESRLYGPHDLALLCIVLAVSALDLTPPPCGPEAQLYYKLAQSALCLQPVLTDRSTVTVKTLHLMSIFNSNSGLESTLEQYDALLNFAGQIALQIGSHNDPSLWGFEGREAYDRRVSFWTLISDSVWQSLVTGRPPVIMPEFIHCRVPTEAEESTYREEDAHPGFGAWSYRYLLDCLAPVIQLTQAVRPPSYQSILELDRKIREYDVPPSRVYHQGLTLLFLHRESFAQAMTDYPSDPINSPLGQSFLSAYHNACIVLDGVKSYHAVHPNQIGRIWRLWSFGFSAAIVVGTVALLGLNLDPPPFEQLEQACSLFKASASMSVCAKKALPILLRLRQKALRSRQEPMMYPTASSSRSSYSPHHDEHGGDFAFGAPTNLAAPRSLTRDYMTYDTAGYVPEYIAHSNEAPMEGHSQGLQQCHRPPHRGQATGDPVVGLPIEWQNLYRIIPVPSQSYTNAGAVYAPQVAEDDPQRGMVFEDRWSTFMHHSMHMVPS